MGAVHSTGYAIYWPAAVETAYKLSPEQISTTMMGILNALFYGLGTTLANILGGLVYERFGGIWLYRGTSFILGWGVLVIIKTAFSKNKGTKDNSVNDSLLLDVKK